ncbi:MAG: hypothetical protein ACR2KM_01875 [Gemmatimonadaceae bacterium]
MTVSTLTPAMAPTRTASRAIEVPWLLGATLFSSLCIVVGLIWDISWHRSVGRDTFWTYPHVLEQIAAIVTGLGCGFVVLRTSFAGSAADRESSVGYWHYFRGPLGAWICIWGTIAMIASAPFDDWWHNAYGLDVKIISPPHMVLASGMIAIQIGALVLAAVAQNRAVGNDARKYDRVFTLGGGILIEMLATIITEDASRPNQMHRPAFYIATAIALTVAMAAISRGGRGRWPATRAALVAMAIQTVMAWLLPLFPATPMLAPIYNPITHMVPPAFPLLLVFPAMTIDSLVRGVKGLSIMQRAIPVGVGTVLTFLVTHWFWAELLLKTQLRYAPIFGLTQWDYNTTVGPWIFEFWGVPKTASGAFNAAAMAAGIAQAMVYATISGMLGLWLGRGLSRVRR